jgi:hypothetical protein
MEYKKPAAVLLAGAFAVNAYDLRYGLQIFTDLPPMSALAAAVSSASVSGILNVPFYSGITDELIEAPAPEKDRTGQS